MEMMNRAIEDAADFRGMMGKIENEATLRMQQLLAQAGSPSVQDGERRYLVVSTREPGENRAAHRARLKRERREAKARKVPA